MYFGVCAACHVSLPLSPAGGLATGADETKSPEERLTYGGIANAMLDPCYHQVHSCCISEHHVMTSIIVYHNIILCMSFDIILLCNFSVV